jgi:PTH1 family peptidyl-tRNA hydrolase
MFGFLKKSDSNMWLLAGLGNPGDKHAGQRHNVGFMALDAIAKGHNFSPFKAKHKGEFTEGRLGGHKVVLIKPQTYMNNSGQSVAAAAKFYKIPPEQIIVFYDEIELPPAKIRVKQGGGNAGHNGLRSIDTHLPGTDYWRVRIGVGRPQHKEQVADYVLSNFSKVEAGLVADLIQAVAANVSWLLDRNENEFMNKVTLATKARD